MGTSRGGAPGSQPRVLRLAGWVSQWSVSLPRYALYLARLAGKAPARLMSSARSVRTSARHACLAMAEAWLRRRGGGAGKARSSR